MIPDARSRQRTPIGPHQCRRPPRVVWLTVLVLLTHAAPPVQAQIVERPSDTRPELPRFEEAPERILPVVPLPTETDELSGGGEFFVEGFRIEGSTVFDVEALDALVAPFVKKILSTADLHRARDRVTQHYIDAGYVNSGAFIPDQDVDDGLVTIQIFEGRLEAIEIRGARHYRPEVLESRVALGARVPLSVIDIERHLQLLQQDPRIARVRARVLPGSDRGLARLEIEIDEATRWQGRAEVNNQQTPGIGSIGGRFEFEDSNVLGFGDTLIATYEVTEGLDRWEGRYDLPLGAHETLLYVEGTYSRSDIVSGLRGQFDELGIRTRFRSFGVGFEQPVFQRPAHALRLGLLAEWRQSNTRIRALEGIGGFPFPGTGADENGEITVSVLRFKADWVTRVQSQVFAVRSTLSIGVDALGAGGGSPDEHFVSWLGQAQWARRFEPLGIEALIRFDVQLANSALPALEQFGVGGFHSVRGYRENQLVRDQGLTAAVEFRIPIYRTASGRDVIQLAPFADLGHSFQVRRRIPDEDPETIGSVGVGLRIFPTEWLKAEFYWGESLTSVDRVGDLQDDGFHFRVELTVP